MRDDDFNTTVIQMILVDSNLVCNRLWLVKDRWESCDKCKYSSNNYYTDDGTWFCTISEKEKYIDKYI